MAQQRHYPVLLEWGPQGARRAAERRDAVFIIDVLSFSTASVTACSYYGRVFVASNETEFQVLQQQSSYRFQTFNLFHFVYNSGLRRHVHGAEDRELDDQDAFVMPRNIGSLCTKIAAHAYAAAIVNAKACADLIVDFIQQDIDHIGGVTLLMCGDFYPAIAHPYFTPDYVFFVEDQLGAGAILSYLPDNISLTADGLAAKAVFESARGDLKNWIFKAIGPRADKEQECLEHSISLDLYDFVSFLSEGCYWDTPDVVLDRVAKERSL
ncbi:hypothetical protein [Armatimonas sp.]|uniref:hypothetical protein n=1 Tax=Armatimonas sp. TaxID=1872638 RepID=UPI00286BD567|nr:hypothetical protein [Armatimonas sp.]